MLAGCSVRPLYDTPFSSAASRRFSDINVDVIAEREGQKLRSYLIDSFRNRKFAGKQYRLTVTLSENEREFAADVDDSAKRIMLTQTAHTILRDNTGNIVFERDISASMSYNIAHSHGEVTLSLYGRHNDHLLKELCARIVENVHMALENEERMKKNEN